ncbi:DEAD-domain-containing protein [Thozetella sp. PMI_491]|nr:DEAD-domain-containing protein [Thozetella sp. PMI_491]
MAAPPPSTTVPYAQMAGRLQPQLLKALDTLGYANMTPVQQKVLSELKTFKDDCLVQAKTGTGKTIAFLLPTLHTLLTSPRKLAPGKVAVLVIAPTRELAQQIAAECDKLTQFCKPPLECHLAFGGSNKKSHMNRFMKGKPSILVATPGRLLDYLQEDEVRVKFSDMRSLILDEADTMLDQGFLESILKILTLLPQKQEAKWQGMCFSATMPAKIHKVLHNVLNPGYPHLSTVDENETPTIDSVPQFLISVPGVEDVIPTLHTLLACEEADNKNLKAVVFSSTARNAGLLYQLFELNGVSPGRLPLFQMHSRMSQAARNKMVDTYKNADRGLLFASDVVGRGMDFPDVGLVVQIGLPINKEQYIHRVGRTGRAGKTGRATVIMTPEEVPFVRIHKEFPIQETTLNHPKASSFPSAQIIKQAFAKIPDQSKGQAYAAYLGFMKGQNKITKLNSASLVQLANRFSASMGCAEPPELEASTIGKMGLKGVPGLRKRPKATAPMAEDGAPRKRRR